MSVNVSELAKVKRLVESAETLTRDYFGDPPRRLLNAIETMRSELLNGATAHTPTWLKDRRERLAKIEAQQKKWDRQRRAKLARAAKSPAKKAPARKR